MKRFFTLLFAIFMTFALTFMICGCGSNRGTVNAPTNSTNSDKNAEETNKDDTNDNSQQPNIVVLDEPSGTVVYNDYNWSLTITGSVRNKGSAVCDHLTIVISIYDGNGSVIDQVEPQIDYLGVGEVWSYRVTTSGARGYSPVSWKCVKIVCS